MRDNDIKEVEIYGQDGNQIYCHRNDFVNLQESHCGFGNTHEEALTDLLKQEKSE